MSARAELERMVTQALEDRQFDQDKPASPTPIAFGDCAAIALDVVLDRANRDLLHRALDVAS